MFVNTFPFIQLVKQYCGQNSGSRLRDSVIVTKVLVIREWIFPSYTPWLKWLSSFLLNASMRQVKSRMSTIQRS